MAETGLDYQTLKNAKWATKKVELSCRQDLSFQHHIDVASLRPEDQSILLLSAKKNDISEKDFRSVVKAYKRRKLLEAQVSRRKSSDSSLWLGDFRDLGEKIASGSVDLILTDPPYDDNALPLYSDVAQLAAREANERIETLEIYKNLAAEPKEYEIHELCNLFPRDEWVVSAIAQSLSNGEPLYCPITLYEGKILDGKIRYEACKRAGVNPKFLVFPDDYPEYKGSAKDFVISANVMRQQLSESQRAVIGVGLMDGVLPAEPKQEIPPMESLEDVLRLHHECEENPEMIPLFLQRVGEYGKAERAKIEQLTGLEGIRECNRMRREAEVISNLLNGYVLDTDRKMEQALIEGKEMFRKHYPKMREKQLEELTSSPEMFIEVCNQRIAELEAAV
jgi:hypothetical protein